MQVGSATNHFTFTAFTWVFVFVNIIMILKKKNLKLVVCLLNVWTSHPWVHAEGFLCQSLAFIFSRIGHALFNVSEYAAFFFFSFFGRKYAAFM